MSPPPTDEAKTRLLAVVVQQCEALSSGAVYCVDGVDVRVSLSNDWQALQIERKAYLPLSNLSALQLETTWKAFCVTFVFENKRGEPSSYTFSFDQLGARARFALSLKVLRLVGKKSRRRSPRAFSKEKGTPS